MNRYLLSLLTLTVLIPGGCLRKEGDLIVKTPPEFQLMCREGIGDTPRSLEMVITPVHPPSCSETYIEMVYTLDHSNMQFKIAGLKTPTPCGHMDRVVNARIDLGWTNEGRYTFHGSLRDLIQCEGDIQFTRHSITMLLNKGGGFSIPESSINRLPEHVIWGFIIAQNEVGFNLVKSFVNTLPHPTDLISPGHYGHFTISGQKEVSILHSPHLPFKIAFVTKNENREQIIDVLQILSQNPDIEQIQLFSAFGKIVI